MTSSTTKLQLHRTCGWNLTDGNTDGKYGDGNFLLVSFFFFDDCGDCLEKKKIFFSRVVY